MEFGTARSHTPVVGAALFGVAIVALTACGGGSENTATTVTETVQATTTTTTEPTRVRGPVGLAANAPFAEWQLRKYDPELIQFGDYYAQDFCKKPEAFYSVNVSGQLIPIEYSLYQRGLGQPSNMPTWTDDVEVKTMIGQYMVTHYCPWTN